MKSDFARRSYIMRAEAGGFQFSGYATVSKLKDNVLLLGGAGLLVTNRILLRAGLRRRVDGWRRAAGLMLRGEESTFVLSAFGLDAGDDVAQFINRVKGLLSGDPVCRVRVERSVHEDRAVPHHEACFTIHAESWVEGPGRFVRPEIWIHDDAPDSMMNMVCRMNDDGVADVWARINHVAADGVPVQEMLSRLELAIGVKEEVIFPTHDEFAPFSGPRKCPCRDGLVEMQTFVDFSRLLAWRKQQNALLPAPMTVSAVILSRLGAHPAFADLHMGTTVEVSAVEGLQRGVGVVVVRPGDYLRKSDGLEKFATDFNRAVELNRLRKSDGCKTLDAAGLLSPNMAKALLKKALAGNRAFGSLALTVLRDAKVFGAPIAAAGHPHGFIALGSIALNAGDGRRVGCLTIKGPLEQVKDYPRLLREAIER